MPGLQYWEPVAFGLLIVGCLWATYSDLTQRIITNRNILAILVPGIITQVLHVFRGTTTWQDVAALATLSVATGFLLFYAGYWSAGDGKFFAATCIALPFTAPTLTFVGIPVKVLSVSLIWALVFLLIRGARPLALTCYARLRRWRSKKTPWRNRLMALSGQIVQLSAFLGLSKLVQVVMPVRLGLLQGLVLALALTWILGLLPVRLRVLVLAPLVGTAGYFVARLSLTEVTILAATYTSAYLGRGLVQLIEKAMPHAVPYRLLGPGCFLKEYLVVDKDGIPHRIAGRDWANVDQEAYSVIAGPVDGALNPDQVAQIRTLIAAGLLAADEKVELSLSVPFAPMIFGGAVVATAPYWPGIFLG